MPPFAALEARLNAAVLEHMPNAEAVHGTLGTADVIYAANGQYIAAAGIVTGSPEMLVSVSQWPTPAEGDAITLNGDPRVLRTPELAHGDAFWRIGLAVD